MTGPSATGPYLKVGGRPGRPRSGAGKAWSRPRRGCSRPAQPGPGPSPRPRPRAKPPTSSSHPTTNRHHPARNGCCPRRTLTSTSTSALQQALTAVQGPCTETRSDEPRDLATVNFGQAQGRNCALCGAQLLADRSLGVFTHDRGLLTEPTELWACAPACRPPLPSWWPRNGAPGKIRDYSTPDRERPAAAAGPRSPRAAGRVTRQSGFGRPRQR